MYLKGHDADEQRKPQIIEDAMFSMRDEKVGVQRVSAEKMVRVDKRFELSVGHSAVVQSLVRVKEFAIVCRRAESVKSRHLRICHGCKRSSKPRKATVR